MAAKLITVTSAAGRRRGWVRSDWVCDPYATVQHHRRLLKFLQGLRASCGADPPRALLVGSKHHVRVNWAEAIGLVDDRSVRRVTPGVLAAATAVYDVLICLDPVQFARHLRNYALPVVGVASMKDIDDFPEILEVIDYLVPAGDSRTDVTLRNLLWKRAGRAPAGPPTPTAEGAEYEKADTAAGAAGAGAAGGGSVAAPPPDASVSQLFAHVVDAGRTAREAAEAQLPELW